MNRKQKIIISITGIFIVLLILVGLTYGYFLTRISGNTNTKSIVVTTANLEIEYDDSSEMINNENIIPILPENIKKDAAIKTFSVYNKPTSKLSYLYVGLKNIVISEELKDKNFKWILYETTAAAENILPVSSGNFKDVADECEIYRTMIIENETKKFELYIYLEENNNDQSDMMNKNFSAKIEISGSTQLVYNYPLLLDNTKNPTQIMRNIDVDAGNYYGSHGNTSIVHSQKNGETINVLFKTNDNNGNFGNALILRQGNSSTLAKYTSSATYTGNGYYKINYTVKDVETYPEIYLLIDLRNKMSSISISNIYISRNHVPVDTNGIKIAYVSNLGNDLNAGNIESSPFKTFNAAILSGANIILAKPGDYNSQTISASGITWKSRQSSNIELYSYENGNFSEKEININNGIKIANLNNDNGLLVREYKEASPIIWQSYEEFEEDKKLEKTSSLNDCKSKKGSYYADGTTLYINPYDNNYKEFIESKAQSIIFKQLNNVILKNITFLYGNGIMFNDVKNATIIKSKVMYSSGDNGSGIAYLRSNGNIYESESFKNSLDGINVHSTSDSENKIYVVNSYNSQASYNFDDGISFHENCSGENIGGNYSHNVKGGIIHVSQGQVINIKNLVTSFNRYGLYLSSNGGPITNYNVYNVLSKNNDYGILVSDGAQVKTKNLILNNNKINSSGTYSVE